MRRVRKRQLMKAHLMLYRVSQRQFELTIERVRDAVAECARRITEGFTPLIEYVNSVDWSAFNNVWGTFEHE